MQRQLGLAIAASLVIAVQMILIEVAAMAGDAGLCTVRALASFDGRLEATSQSGCTTGGHSRSGAILNCN
jgi:hypothetical protein